MSSFNYNILFKYNEILSCQSPGQYIRSHLMTLSKRYENKDSRSLKIRRIIVESNPFAISSKIPDDSGIKALPDMNLPFSSESVLALTSYFGIAYVLSHMIALSSRSVRTFECKRAYARNFFKKFLIPLAIPVYAIRCWQKEKILNQVASKLEPISADGDFTSRDVQLVLWKERQSISELINRYEAKLNQVREGYLDKKPKTLQNLNKEANITSKDDNLQIRSPEDKQKTDQIKKQIEKEKNYMEALFIDLDDALEEVEGSEIAFLQK